MPMQKDDRTFGQRLRAARIAAGYSQSELEEISGIPKARLSRYENGHVAPSIQTLERLARALEVSEASLLGDQRAVLEELFRVLDARGVHVSTPEQGAVLGNAIADILQAAGQAGAEDSDPPEPIPAAPLASVRDWLRPGDGTGVDSG